ncbi:toluene tolerance protein [Skermanella stibiiresistens SB22]|jgi:phospholipid transport system substrate-binding protein|uniref:Toluene tolerance protein n=1 Tax=Skermanella stibiiresistens SB22 TaxID=1385369 RepID=W9H3U7_9PROT|nr:ABC transporter substrate-binding protein [Skermanella stibiiresistens]EWY39402.1 toluene tolerance protein [Skermanella stibiiresistens SB22]
MIRRRFLIACAALLAFAGTAALPSAGHADARSEAAAKFIQDLGARAIDVLVKPSLGREESMKRFRVLLNEGFDVPYISRFVLGANWRTATPQQQQEYGTLFERLIVQVYADRFSQYSGQNLDVNETLKITGHRPEGDSDAIVNSQIIRPDAPPVAVDWRVRQRGDTMKVIDVAVEGVSMSVTQRSEFSSVIQRGGGQIESLLQTLRQRVGTAG